MAETHFLIMDLNTHHEGVMMNVKVEEINLIYLLFLNLVNTLSFFYGSVFDNLYFIYKYYTSSGHLLVPQSKL